VLCVDELPEDEIVQWVVERLGPIQVVSRFAHDHGYSKLWRLATNDGHAWLKMHTFPNKWGGEVHALTRWTPAIGQAPMVLAHRTEPVAVILTEVDGFPAESLALESKQEERMWREAGAWLAKLHAIENDWFGGTTVEGQPHGEPERDPTTFVRKLWNAIHENVKASGLVTGEEIHFIRGEIENGLPSFEGETPRAIHRDFTPRNWMAHPDGTLTAVIDFEHSRWDVRAMDLTRPWDYEFRRNPRLIDAFYDGYGGLDDRLKAQIETLRAMLTLSTIVWATKVNDLPFAQRYRDALDRRMGRTPADARR
jgi:Ser/Thr protein kinase RdoA (MazF antagonist)